MARPAVTQSLGNASEPSIGDLVSQAIKDVTTLVKCEIDLAKVAQDVQGSISEEIKNRGGDSKGKASRNCCTIHMLAGCLVTLKWRIRRRS